MPLPFLTSHEGRKGAPVRNYRRRSSYESDNVPRSIALARRAVRTVIGQDLRAHYEVPQDLPHGMLTLLMQLGKREEEE